MRGTEVRGGKKPAPKGWKRNRSMDPCPPAQPRGAVVRKPGGRGGGGGRSLLLGEGRSSDCRSKVLLVSRGACGSH